MKATLIFILTLLSACSFYQRGDTLKQENGIVVGKQFVPDSRGTAVGTGFSSSGSMVTTVHSYGEKEKYVIIFKCDHNVLFSINDPAVYSKLSEGDTVIIDYYELLNKSKQVKDYEFIDANKILTP